MKDEETAHPIPDQWRPVLRDIVKALADGDYMLSRNVPSVATVAKTVADQMRAYVADYGEALAELPDETWETSVSQWQSTHWDVVVDLWTRESGRSDMVLCVRVFEVADALRFEIDSVHVP